ncbi:MAG: M20 family metallopeptidase [Anaerovoracaceae bacterium]
MIELLKQYRRDLHRIPEVGYQEFKTHAYILEILCDYPCEITEFSPTGICAFFQAKNPNQPGAVAFRSDMDALPIEEITDSSYRSTHPGTMHACGHDGHMAMLLGLAGELAKLEGDIPINVLLIFQPAEESPGGAKAIAASGIFEKYDVRRIFAFHMAPSETPGVIMSRPMEMMARSSELTVTIHGRSAHIASAHKGIDALRIGCLYLDALYKIERDLLPPEEFRVLRFGKMTGGTARNAIAEKAVLEGSLRAFREETFRLLSDEILRTATEYENSYGCKIEIHFTEGYPPAMNDPHLYQQAKEVLSPDRFPFSSEFITLRKPSMASDDFSYYLQKVPGLYLFLGTGNKKPLHSNAFDFDEEVLEVGVKAYLQLLQLPLLTEPQSNCR